MDLPVKGVNPSGRISGRIGQGTNPDLTSPVNGQRSTVDQSFARRTPRICMLRGCGDQLTDELDFSLRYWPWVVEKCHNPSGRIGGLGFRKRNQRMNNRSRCYIGCSARNPQVDAYTRSDPMYLHTQS